jgi:hypothetical protein
LLGFGMPNIPSPLSFSLSQAAFDLPPGANPAEVANALNALDIVEPSVAER